MSVTFLNNVSIYLYDKQECIPVGCVPPTSVAVSVGWGGGVILGVCVVNTPRQTPPLPQADTSYPIACWNTQPLPIACLDTHAHCEQNDRQM